MKKSSSTLVTSIERLCTQYMDQDLILLGGTPCSQTNRTIFVRMFEAWLYSCEDLMLRLCLSEQARRSRMRNFAYALLQADFVEILLSFDKLYHQLITDSISDYNSFKHYCNHNLSDQVDWERLLSPINLAIGSFLTETNNKTKAQFLSVVAQFLRFPRKLDFQTLGLETVALEAYLEVEQQLDTRDDDASELYKSLSDIIRNWFGSFHIDNLRPNHGSGSVAEGPLTIAEKFGVMQVDTLLKVLLRNCSFPDSYLEYFPIRPGDNLSRISRTIFVPKTATKLRTISMEPATLQYIQQGVMYELYSFIERHHYLMHRIKLSDQTQNQYLALEGSSRHNYATIDLSHASDSVSWDLVRKVFSATPSLFKWLLATRSKQTLLPTGDVIPLKKFAPMGSALCFPIECILFGAVAELASRNVCRHSNVPQELWSVYGDDIIVPSAVYEETIRILQLLGFSVNESKSHNSGNYRESCGKECYAGYDITPLSYRIPFYRKRPSPAAYSSWCSGANNAYYHRLPYLRLHFIDKIKTSGLANGPYFTENPEESPFLYSPQPTNFHVKKFWHKDYQVSMGKFASVQSKQRDGKVNDDTLRYFIKLVQMSKRRSGVLRPSDELSSEYPVHGTVEFFSSTILPMEPRWKFNELLAQQWWEA